MPEIAEVESVARVLDSKYIGKKLIKIETYPEIHQKGLPRLIKSDNFNTIENKANIWQQYFLNIFGK